MPSCDPQTFRDVFDGELRRLDIRADTFASILSRVHARVPLPVRRLNRRELNHLHGLYLNALSDALRETGSRVTDLVA